MLFIRPRHASLKPQGLLGFVLTTTNGEILTDEQILEHFPVDTTGVEIRASAREFHGTSEVGWGDCLFTD